MPAIDETQPLPFLELQKSRVTGQCGRCFKGCLWSPVFKRTTIAGNLTKNPGANCGREHDWGAAVYLVYVLWLKSKSRDRVQRSQRLQAHPPAIRHLSLSLGMEGLDSRFRKFDFITLDSQRKSLQLSGNCPLRCFTLGSVWGVSK